MASDKNLQELFHETLKDIYFAEKKILSALPKMAKAAQSAELKAAFEKHETETEEHVARLEKVFAEIDEAPRGKTCDAIMGIIEEGQEASVRTLPIAQLFGRQEVAIFRTTSGCRFAARAERTYAHCLPLLHCCLRRAKSIPI